MRAVVSIESSKFPVCVLEKNISFGAKFHHNPYRSTTHQTSTRGCDVVGDFLFVARAYTKKISCVACFRIALQQEQYVFELLSENRVKAQDVHDIKVVQFDGKVALIAVVSTANDSLVLMSYDVQLGCAKETTFVEIGKGKDDHHINSISVLDGHIYLTCHNHESPGDVVKVFPDGTYEFMKLRGPDDADYLNPHNFHMLSNGKYIIGDSKNNRVVLCADDKYVVRELGGWVRGICVLNGGNEFIVGVNPRRGRASDDLDTLEDVSVFLLDSALNILDVCALDIPSKCGIFSIRRLAK